MDFSYPKHHFLKPGPLGSCQVCAFGSLEPVLDLGDQPLCDTLLAEQDLNKPETKYPLSFFWCPNCSLGQINYCVDEKVLYHKSYPYRTGATQELVDYISGFAASLAKKFNLGADDLVVDIGSNDGTLLAEFKKLGTKVIGVEPTDAAQVAAEKGIETIQDFFNIKVAQDIIQSRGPVSLIIGTSLLERTHSLGETLAGIELLLKDGGIFVLESHYLLDIITGGQFDSIYHEHLRTFSLKSLIKLFDYYNFTVTEVEKGFSFRSNIKVFVAKGKNKPVSPSVAEWLEKEQAMGLNNLATYKQFAGRAQKSKDDFLSFLSQNAGVKKIGGNSCPARCVTMLNYFGADKDFIPYIAERPGSPKIGMYLPGRHIPIVSNEILLQEQPDYLVLLAWYYAEPIMGQLKARGILSDFIVPLPDFRLVKNSEISKAL